MSKTQEIANLKVGLDMEMQSFARELSNTKKTVRNLSKDFDVASKSIDQADNKMEAMAQAMTKGNKAFEATEKKLQMQNKQFDDLYKKTENQKKQYDELSAELKKAEKALEDMARNGDKSSSAYKEQEKSVKDLKKALADKLELVQKNSHKLQQYSTDIDKTTTDLSKLRSSIDDIETSMTSMDAGVDGLSKFKEVASEAGIDLGLLELGAKAAAIAIAAVFAKNVYEGAISYDNAITDLRLSLGLTEKSAKDLLDQLNQITDGGYSVEGITESVKYLEQRFNLGAKETENLAQSMDLLSRMGYESADVVRFMTSAVNDWGMNHEQALDMIISGEQAGLNISKDWLDALVEYTPILSTLGVKGEEAFALVDEAVNATGMTTDQAMDMVKEFFLTLTDGSTTSKDAFKDLGIDIEDFKKKIDSGSITSVEAMQKVMKSIMGVSDETERARLMQEIFKGTIEYGSDGVIEAWSNIETSVSNTAGAMDEAKQAYEDSYAAMQQDLSNEWNELKQTVGSGVLPVLKEVVSFTTKSIKTLGLAPAGASAMFTQMGNDIGNAFDGAYGKVLEFVMWSGDALADFADSIGFDGIADSMREGLEGAEESHKDLVKRIGERNKENERLNEEHAKKLEAIWGNTELDVEIDSSQVEETVVKLTETYDKIPQEIKTVMKAEDEESKDKALKLYNEYEKLPKEIQTLISADNYKALEGAKNIQDVLSNIPVEKRVDLLASIQEEGNMSAEQLQMILDSLPEEERVKIETQIAGKEQIEKTKKDLDTMPKESKSQVTVDTGDSKKKVQDVKKEVESVNGKTSKVTLTTDTSKASKNVTGLKKNIDDYDRKHTNKTKKTTFNTITSQASKNVTGLKNNISSFVSRYSKSFTTTFNVVTKYKTIGSPTTQSSGAKIGRSVAQPYVKTLSTVAKGIQRSVTDGVAAIDDFNSTEITPRNPVDVQTPITRGYSDPLQTHKYGLNHFIELENQLKKLASKLDILDEKAKKAFGQEKINYLNQQNDLLKQQQQVQSKLTSEMQRQQQALKGFLGNNGLSFDGDGNISNYHTKLVAMNKELERLEELSKKASDASSNYKGDNEAERDRLSNASKAASEQASKYKENLDEIKKAMDEYLSITFDDIPKAKEEWEKLNTEIKETSDSIEELNRNQALFVHQNKVKELEYEYDKLSDRLDLVDAKLKNAYGTDKLKLIENQISLLKQQQQIQNQLVNSYKNQAGIYRGNLSRYGFNFDGNGDFTNLDENLNKFKNHKDLEKIQKLVEEYIKIQRDELPDATKEWEKLEGEIKSLYKEQLNITKDIEDKITDAYKKQVEERKKLIDEELDTKLKALDKEKKAYQDYRDKVDYQNDYEDQLNKIHDLQAEYDKISGDNSLGSKKKLEELLKQIEEEQKKLEELVQNKIDKDVSDMFDKESDRLEVEAENTIKELEDKFSDAKIEELVSKALGSGVFTDIEGNISSLEDAMVNFAEGTGELFGVLGSTIERELITNLHIALDTFKDLDSMLDNLNLDSMSGFSIPNVDYSSARYRTSSNVANNTTNNNSTAIEVSFDQPLVVVQGNVTKDVMPDLNEWIKKAEKEICKNIVSKINGR